MACVDQIGSIPFLPILQGYLRKALHATDVSKVRMFRWIVIPNWYYE